MKEWTIEELKQRISDICEILKGPGVYFSERQLLYLDRKELRNILMEMEKPHDR